MANLSDRQRALLASEALTDPYLEADAQATAGELVAQGWKAAEAVAWAREQTSLFWQGQGRERTERLRRTFPRGPEALIRRGGLGDFDAIRELRALAEGREVER